jgi:hypothetical protein
MYYFTTYQPQSPDSIVENGGGSDDEDGTYYVDMRLIQQTNEQQKQKEVDTASAWSYSTAVRASEALQQVFAFERLDYKELRKPNMQKILSAFNLYCKRGLLTKQEKVPRDQALGFNFIRRIVNDLSMKVVTSGTSSRDTILQFALLFVVQAALSVRAGDILVPDIPQQFEGVDRSGMRYSDI